MRRALVLAVLLAAAPAVADPDADARQAVAAWLAAQNGGDYAAYAASYDPRFVGIRRVSNGGERRMKRRAWLADRKKMFRRPQQVAGDGLTVTVTGGVATARLTQRWKSGGYADHGTKVLRLAPDGGGAMKIVHEELLSSTPGWDDDPQAVLDATGLAPSVTVWLRGEGVDRSLGCPKATWVLYLTDGTRTLQRELGQTDLTPNDDTATTVVALPDDTDALYRVGDWCAGGATEFTLKHSGDAVVVRRRDVDECTGDTNACAPDQTTVTLTVQLPEGARLRAR